MEKSPDQSGLLDTPMGMGLRERFRSSQTLL